MKLTKKMMVDYIEQTGLVVDFNRNYLMRKDKEYIEGLYLHCQNISGNNN